MTAEIFNLDPNMTTSKEWHEEKKEEREELGAYFGDRISVTEGTQKPSGVVEPDKKSPSPSRAFKPLTNDQGMLYSPLGGGHTGPLTPPEVIDLSKRQKKQTYRKG